MSIELLEVELEQPDLETIHFLNRFWQHTPCKRVSARIGALTETQRFLVFELADILAGLPNWCTPSREISSGAPH